MFKIIHNSETVDFTSKTIYVDTETIGLYGSVRLLQVYCPEVSEDSVYIFDVEDYPLILMKKRLSEAAKTIWQNGKYDFDCLNWIPTEWEDTFLLDLVVNFKADKHSLDVVMTGALGFDPYKDFDKKIMQKSNWSGKLTDEQLRYAAIDVYYLHPTYEALKVAESDWNYKLDKSTVVTFSKMGQRLPIDIPSLEQHKLSNENKIAELNVPINCNSYLQVRKYIDFEQSDDDALARLCSEGNTKACNVRTVRSLRKQISFINKFMNERKESYIYGHLNVGTRSGRSKCSNQNLQQIPQAFKGYIRTEKWLVYADYAQLELRSLCALIGEQVLEKLFRERIDMHTFVKESLFGTDDTQEISDAGRGNSLRQIAKIFNFASLYGAGFKTIGGVLTKYTGMRLSEAELKKHKKKWLDTFPGIRKWHSENIRHWQAKRTLSTPMGRKYIGNLPTDANSIMNQGASAEVAKLAIVRMAKELDMSKMLVFVHDSYTYEADTEEEAKHVAEVMAKCMSEAWFDVTKFMVIKDLPMPVEAYVKEYGSWKDVEDGELYKYDIIGKDIGWK